MKKEDVYVVIDTTEKGKRVLDILNKAGEPIYDTARINLERTGLNDGWEQLHFSNKWLGQESLSKTEISIEQLVKLLGVTEEREFKVGDRVRCVAGFKNVNDTIELKGSYTSESEYDYSEFGDKEQLPF